MKFLKLSIRRRKIENKTQYDYPTPHYEAAKAKILVYEGGLEVNAQVARDRGKDDELVLVGVDDGDLAQFLKADRYEKDGFTYGAEEIDLDAMKSIGDIYTGQAIKITDENKVMQICAKAALGETLTQEDKDALDPTKSDVSGIIKTEKFSDGLTKRLQAEIVTP